MQDIYSFLIGIIILILAVPIGNWLARVTKDEANAGQKWFTIVVIVALGGALLSLVFWNDILLFTFLFIAIVASRSLRAGKRKKKK